MVSLVLDAFDLISKFCLFLLCTHSIQQLFLLIQSLLSLIHNHCIFHEIHSLLHSVLPILHLLFSLFLLCLQCLGVDIKCLCVFLLLLLLLLDHIKFGFFILLYDLPILCSFPLLLIDSIQLLLLNLLLQFHYQSFLIQFSISLELLLPCLFLLQLLVSHGLLFHYFHLHLSWLFLRLFVLFFHSIQHFLVKHLVPLLSLLLLLSLIWDLFVQILPDLYPIGLFILTILFLLHVLQ